MIFHVRLRRLLQLVNLLQSGKGHNSASLAKECGVARRTIYRDIDLLKQAGLPLIVDLERQQYALRGTRMLPPTEFTTEESLALLVLCYEMGGDRGLPFHPLAASAALKLESNLPAVIREYLRLRTNVVRISLAQINPLKGRRPIYQQLMDAIGLRQAVRIRYASLAEDQTISTKLHPYRLWFSRRSWYVIGRSSIHRAVRTFNVGRIQELQVLEDTFRIPHRFTFELYFRNAWHMIPERGKDHDVVIRFQKLVAHNVAEVLWHKTQQVKWNPDGSMDFHVRVSGLGEITWWVLGYGQHAEVIKPLELRARVLEHVEALRNRYDASTPQVKKSRHPRKQRNSDH